MTKFHQGLNTTSVHYKKEGKAEFEDPSVQIKLSMHRLDEKANQC